MVNGKCYANVILCVNIHTRSTFTTTCIQSLTIFPTRPPIFIKVKPKIKHKNHNKYESRAIVSHLAGRLNIACSHLNNEKIFTPTSKKFFTSTLTFLGVGGHPNGHFWPSDDVTTLCVLYRWRWATIDRIRNASLWVVVASLTKRLSPSRIPVSWDSGVPNFLQLRAN